MILAVPVALACSSAGQHSPSSSSSTRMVVGPGYDCESGNKGKASSCRSV